jgi:CheY-like chemotaxis protein
MKILLVDDEQALLDVFSSTLQTGGFEVVTAITGTEGIDKAKSEKPNIILLDQMLPDINGNQVLQILKQDPLTQSIPVAMLSNFNQDGLVQEAINLGALDYIMKYQVGPHDLIEKINQLLEEHATGAKTTLPAELKSLPIQPEPAPVQLAASEKPLFIPTPAPISTVSATNPIPSSTPIPTIPPVMPAPLTAAPIAVSTPVVSTAPIEPETTAPIADMTIPTVPPPMMPVEEEHQESAVSN